MAKKIPQTQGPMQIDRKKLEQVQEEQKAQQAAHRENEQKRSHYMKLIEEMAPAKEVKETGVFFNDKAGTLTVLLYDKMGYPEGAMTFHKSKVMATNFDMNTIKLTLVMEQQYREGGERKVPNIKTNKEGKQYQDGYKDAPYFVGRHDIVDIIGIEVCEKVYNFIYGEHAFVPIRQTYVDVDSITQKINERFEKEIAEGKHRPVESGLVDAQGNPLTQDSVKEGGKIITLS